MSQSEIDNDRVLNSSPPKFESSSKAVDSVDDNYSVDSIKSEITTKVRPTLYTLQFAGAHPRGNDPALKAVLDAIGNPTNSRKLSRLCEEITWPGKTYSTQPSVVANNPVVKMPYTATYTGEITATFQLEPNNQIMNMFQLWHERIMSEDQTQMSYYYDYCCPSLTIKQLTTDGHVQFAIVIEEIWPESIRERTYGQNLANQLTRHTVSFAFKKWKYLPASGLPGGELVNSFGLPPQLGDVDEYGSLIGG